MQLSDKVGSMFLLLNCRRSLSLIQSTVYSCQFCFSFNQTLHTAIEIGFVVLVSISYILLLHQVIEDLLWDCVNIFSNVLDGNNLNGWLELQEVSD